MAVKISSGAKALSSLAPGKREGKAPASGGGRYTTDDLASVEDVAKEKGPRMARAFLIMT
jgi:hypothetical protein